MNDAIGWFAAWLLFVLLLFLPQYIYVRFFMPYETLSEDETRKFRELQKIDNLSGRLGSNSGQPLLVRKTADSGEKSRVHRFVKPSLQKR